MVLLWWIFALFQLCHNLCDVMMSVKHHWASTIIFNTRKLPFAKKYILKSSNSKSEKTWNQSWHACLAWGVLWNQFTELSIPLRVKYGYQLMIKTRKALPIVWYHKAQINEKVTNTNEIFMHYFQHNLIFNGKKVKLFQGIQILPVETKLQRQPA